MPPMQGMDSDASSVSMPASPRIYTVRLVGGRERMREM